MQKERDVTTDWLIAAADTSVVLHSGTVCSLLGKINLTFRTLCTGRNNFFFLYSSVSSGRFISSALPNSSLYNRLSGRHCFGIDLRRSYKHSTSVRCCGSLVSILSEWGKKATAESIVSLFLFGNGKIHPHPRGRKIHQGARGEGEGGKGSGRQHKEKSGIKNQDENAQRLK